MAELEKKINFGIKSISELGFKYVNPFEFKRDFTPQKYPIEARLTIKYRWELEKDIFAVDLNYVFAFKNEDDTFNEVINLASVTEFDVDNLKDILTIRTVNDFDMDQRLESTLVGLSISTGRGILYEKTKGTLLAGFIFPIVNPMNLILSKNLKEKKEAAQAEEAPPQ